MTSVAQLIEQLNGLSLRSADTSTERARKLARRAELAQVLCDVADPGAIDADTCVGAAQALRYVSSAGTTFVEAAQRLAKAAWQAGHPEGADLYASTTDLLCNRRHRPQRYGTLTYVRHGEKVLQPVDTEVNDEERRALGLPTLVEIETEIAENNRRLAEDLARTTGLPDGTELRRVWRDEDPSVLLARRQEVGPVWRDGDELVFVWQAEAAEVILAGGLQMPLWPLPGSDLWVLRVRIRDLDRAVVGYGFVGRQEPDEPVGYLGGDGCWRGPLAPGEPRRNRPLAGSLRVMDLAGPSPGEQRTITAYLPPGHDAGGSYPVVYMADGQMTNSLADVLDAAIVDGRAPPVVLVGVASGVLPGEDLRNDEYIVGCHPERFEAHQAFFVGEVAAWAESELGVACTRDRRFTFGASSGAAFAVTMGLRHPELYGKILAFSLGVVPVDEVTWPRDQVPGHYLAAGTLEEGFRRVTASWAAQVAGAGGACAHVELVSGHDHRMWEMQFPVAVAWAIA